MISVCCRPRASGASCWMPGLGCAMHTCANMLKPNEGLFTQGHVLCPEAEQQTRRMNLWRSCLASFPEWKLVSTTSSVTREAYCSDASKQGSSKQSPKKYNHVKRKETKNGHPITRNWMFFEFFYRPYARPQPVVSHKFINRRTFVDLPRV